MPFIKVVSLIMSWSWRSNVKWKRLQTALLRRFAIFRFLRKFIVELLNCRRVSLCAECIVYLVCIFFQQIRSVAIVGLSVLVYRWATRFCNVIGRSYDVKRNLVSCSASSPRYVPSGKPVTTPISSSFWTYASAQCPFGMSLNAPKVPISTIMLKQLVSFHLCYPLSVLLCFHNLSLKWW